jgi:serine/threonine protein kinase
VHATHESGCAAGEAMDELTGTTFAGLEVRDAVAHDMVSTVYRALDSERYRAVSLRVVAADLCSTHGHERELYERFLREAGAALSFEHPLVPTVEEVGEHHGRGYLVSEQVDAIGFAAYVVQHGPLDLDEATELFSQVADILDAGHLTGLTHGAVNPSTLRIATPADGPAEARLTGFGIGPLLELRLRRNRRNLRDIDDLLYVAPEQLRQQAPTSRTDQYAMACALVHALTGSPPFVRDSVEGLFGAHLFVAPTALSGAASNAAILKALAKEPRDRYVTCGQMIADLTRVQGGAGHRSSAGHRSAARDRPELLSGAPIDPSGGSPVAGAPAPARVDHGPEPPAAVDDWPEPATAVDDMPQPVWVPQVTSPPPADKALSNGASGTAERRQVDTTRVEHSSTSDEQSPGMAYPSSQDGPEAGPETGTVEDLDDVPLLSEVLSRRSHDPEPATRRPLVMLVALAILAVLAVAAVVWFILA